MVARLRRCSVFMFARRSPKSCAATGPVACRGSVLSSIGRCSCAQQCSHTVARNRDGSKRRDTSPSTRVPRTGITLKPTFTQGLLQPRRVQLGKGQKQEPPLGRLLLYYDDVSSGPSPEGSLVHADSSCCSDTAPYWTRIALHRVPVPTLDHYSA